jgi:phosphoglycolate phosphatase
MKQYQAYIFDLDGTLLNTLDDLAASVNYALRSNGLPERTKDEVRQFVGNGVGKLIERAVPYGTSADVTSTVLATFKTYYINHSSDMTCPYDGVIEMLDTLRAHGKRVAVVSNKFDRATKELCLQYFGERVEVAIGESDTVVRKPSPDGINEAMRLLGVSASDTVYIGDSDVDILTARNAGIPCISVLWGFRDKDFLLEHGAETLADSPLALIADVL